MTEKIDLAHVCGYFKACIVPQMPKDFAVAEHFRYGLTDDELRNGMTAFRNFLYKLFSQIAEDKDKIDVIRGSKYDPHGTKGDRGTASIKECFPVFNDLTIILLSLGFHGRLSKTELTIDGKDMLIVIDPVTEPYQSVIRMSGERKLEMFRLLSDLGLRFDGADFSREVDFSKTAVFRVTSDKNDFFHIGLKLIADAMINNKYYIKLENLFGHILRRGDFKPLANATPKRVSVDILEYANAQPPEIKEWIVDLNKFLLSSGCTMVHGTSTGPFSYKKRGTNLSYGMVCIIDMGIWGCSIVQGVNHLSRPDSIVNFLPDEMVEMLKNGKEKFDIKDCKRNKGNMGFARYTFTHNGTEYEGCRHAGIRCHFSERNPICRFKEYKFDLSDPAVREIMWKWIEMEVS
jgi:hypothetical protein